MIDKEKLTPIVWWQDVTWTVVKVLSPDTRSEYLLLQRPSEDEIYEDGSKPTEMALLDANDCEWYPDTKKVRKLMKKRQAADQAKKSVKDELTAIWLDSFEIE